MTANAKELSAIVGALQVDREAQALRDERIEKELSEMRKSAVSTNSNISKLTNILTRSISKSEHVESEVIDLKVMVNKITDRTTVLEIKGQERETKIKMLVLGAAAIVSAVSAWVVSLFKG